jgi:hypothetical protein
MIYLDQLTTNEYKTYLKLNLFKRIAIILTYSTSKQLLFDLSTSLFLLSRYYRNCVINRLFFGSATFAGEKFFYHLIHLLCML